MTLSLIAHKVRGEPAFDVAEQMTCPECHGEDVMACPECNYTGFWWIIPTSGHRAYPILTWTMDDFTGINPIRELGPVLNHPSWAALPDHYHISASRQASAVEDLLALLPSPSFNKRKL